MDFASGWASWLMQGDWRQLHDIVISSEQQPVAGIEWIDRLSQFAKTGYLQAALLAIAVLQLILGAFRSSARSLSVPVPDVKASKIRWPYEICAQVSRAATLTFLVLAATRAELQWANVVLVGYAFVIGLSRAPVRNLLWRHLALHQINLILAGTLFLLLAAYVLPLVELGNNDGISKPALYGIEALAVSVFIALITPKEYVPPPSNEYMSQRTPDSEASPEETASWFSDYLSYGWLTPLIWRGSRKAVEMSDLPSLPWYDEPLLLLSRIQAARKGNFKTLWTVLRYMRVELLKAAFWSVLAFSVELVSPFALYQLLGYIQAPDEAVLSPVIWLALLFIGPMARSVCFQRYIFTNTRLLVRVKSAMTQELYARAFSSQELTEETIKEIAGKNQGHATSIGQISNLMSSDVDAITNARDIIMIGVGVPVGFAISIVGLYKITGWPSLVGVAVMVLGIPFPTWIAHAMGNSQRRIKAAQDSRMSLVSEYLSSIRAVKYFAWEDYAQRNIGETRKAEQKELWTIALLWTAMGEITDLIPLIALLSIFVLYAAVLRLPLTPPVAFTTLSLTMTMRRHLAMFGYLSRGVTNAAISIERLDRYFKSTTPIQKYPVGPLTIQDATFRRTKTASFYLRDITISFVEGGLNVLTGQSGSGKTSLLLSILGETVLESGYVTKPADVAYASQTPWLQSDTIKENILFDSPYEEVRYERVIKACALEQDLAELTKGEDTEIGENGAGLSGGQKARVALARAIYSKAPLLLLDDVFSALDTKTSAVVWKQCFCSDLLKGRTVVLVAHAEWVASQADLTVKFEDGVVVSSEQNLGVVRKPVSLEQEAESAEAVQEEIDANGKTALSEAKPPAAPVKAADAEIADEMKTGGKANRLQFFKYMLYYGSPAYAIFCLATNVALNAFLVGSSYWLTIWVNQDGKHEATNVAFYLGIYAAFTLGTIVVDAVCFLAYMRGGWIAARTLHDKFLRAVLNAPLGWWKNTPVGRVVNRFSRDMNSLDSILSRMVLFFLDTFVNLFFRLGAISSILPIFMLPGLVTCFIGVVCGELYTRTAVTVKKLVSAAQSPVFSQFSDSMTGLAVIRARSEMPQVFALKLAKRLRDFSRASQTNYNTNRWVAVRVDFVTACVTVAAGIIAVSKARTIAAGLVGFSLTNASSLSETILYLVRSMNELEVEMQSFNRVEEYANVEPEEKIDEAPAKDTHIANGNGAEYSPRENWPQTGSVEFRNVTVRYDADGQDILKDINLKFSAGERVAVVGRTGSGKSTLVLTLLRFTEVMSGQILFDGVDITAVSRRKLRQEITVIPQEATLFSGDVKSNLDPSGEVEPNRLQLALESCGGLASFSSHHQGNGEASQAVEPEEEQEAPTEQTPLLNGKGKANGSGSGSGSGTLTPTKGLSLATVVSAKGENFSQGQRQVLALARAMVKQSKLMLLDEATASMDYETDKGIQEILRAEMNATGRERTLVTIAHRLRTIADYDKVLVLGAGRVLEFGSPSELYAKKSHFYEMVQHSGEKEDLEGLMGP